MKEQWKRIYPNWEVSSEGRIRNYFTGHYLAIRQRKDGYLDVKLSYKKFLVHRLVARAFISNPYNFRQVNHLNGKRNDSSVKNLEWCDQFHNMKHAINNGLFPNRKGIKNGRAKITEEQASLIKSALREGVSVSRLVKEFAVTHHIVYNIKNGKAWKWL